MSIILTTTTPPDCCLKFLSHPKLFHHPSSCSGSLDALSEIRNALLEETTETMAQRLQLAQDIVTGLREDLHQKIHSVSAALDRSAKRKLQEQSERRQKTGTRKSRWESVYPGVDHPEIPKAPFPASACYDVTLKLPFGVEMEAGVSCEQKQKQKKDPSSDSSTRSIFIFLSSDFFFFRV